MTRDPLADFDAEILLFLQSAGVDPSLVQLSTPPEREFGERATNVALRLAREWRRPPQQIAQDIAGQFTPGDYRFIARVEPAGPGFINFYLDYSRFVPHAVESIRAAGSLYGRRSGSARHRVVVEHTSVNPNKEWHIGHVRNAVLGDVITRLLRLAGHDVQVQNYIDDTGLQGAQAVLAVRDFPEEEQPGEKYDHFAGRHYVKIAAELAAEKDLLARLAELTEMAARGEDSADLRDERESIEARLSNLERLKRDVLKVMRALEEGEYHEVTARILDAQLETAYRLGIYYDLLNWESHLVQAHVLEQALDRLQQSPEVYRAKEGRYAGALVIRTGGTVRDGDEPKAEVLMRSNGIPTYVGKDIAYHMWKFHLLPDRLCYVKYRRQPNGQDLWSTALHGEDRADPAPDRIINVIAVHQSQAQETVKQALSAAGFTEQADRYVHLAYGMVRSREGKISGRKGTAPAGDDVIDEAVKVAYERVQEKRSQDLSDQDMQAIAASVGVGALRYFMVQYNPLREIVFDVRDVVSYDGNTGLYVQYALVRTFAILRRAAEAGIRDEEIAGADPSLLQHEQERRLIYHMAQYPTVVADASRTLSVNLVAEYAFDLATIFSQFYRDCSVLQADPIELRNARLLLVRTVRDALVNACGVLGVPIIERL